MISSWASRILAVLTMANSGLFVGMISGLTSLPMVSARVTTAVINSWS